MGLSRRRGTYPGRTRGSPRLQPALASMAHHVSIPESRTGSKATPRVTAGRNPRHLEHWQRRPSRRTGSGAAAATARDLEPRGRAPAGPRDWRRQPRRLALAAPVRGEGPAPGPFRCGESMVVDLVPILMGSERGLRSPTGHLRCLCHALPVIGSPNHHRRRSCCAPRCRLPAFAADVCERGGPGSFHRQPCFRLPLHPSTPKCHAMILPMHPTRCHHIAQPTNLAGPRAGALDGATQA